VKIVKNTALWLFITLLASCSSQINGTLREQGSAVLAVEAALEPRMSTFIRSLNDAMGNTSAENILDGPSIGSSLAASRGVQTVILENSGPAALEGSIVISKVEDFLAGSRGAPFATYQNESGGGKAAGNMLIFLDRDNVGDLIALFSTDVKYYLEALMAPIIENDDIPKDEYLSLIASIYGRPIAEEIREAMIYIVIDFPGPIKSISGGRPVGSLAVFDIPIIDLLTLENPLSWEVVW